MHTIRLRGPWDFRPDEGETRTIRLPSDDISTFVAEAQQTCLFERRFNRPTGIADEEVYLAVLLQPFSAQVNLNGERLGTTKVGQPTRCPIRQRITDHNLVQLSIDMENASSCHDNGVLEVALEIDSSSN